MTYNHVDLIQRGISSNQHAVSGKSGKLYGHAVNTPKDGGVTFRMSLRDYLEAAHDICGNTTPGQQWVPMFIGNNGATPARPKCDRCSNPSVAVWDRFSYCAADAPANATWYDEEEHQQWLAQGGQSQKPAPTGAETPDVQPVVQEKLTGGLTSTDTELPPETMAAPIMGTEKEGQDEDEIPAAMRVPKPAAPGAVAQPPPAVASEKVEPAAQSSEQPPAPAPKAVAIIGAITEGVIKAVMPQLKQIIDERMAGLELPATPAPPPPVARPVRQKRDHRKKAEPSRPGPTEFQNLQREAKSLGINLYGKGKDALVAEIAKKKGSGKK